MLGSVNLVAVFAVNHDPVTLANDLRPILLRLARHLRAEADTRGLTAGQVSILVAIQFHPGITAQQLADREALSGAGVSGHLARLEGRKLLRRERAEDGRRIGLFLTGEGERLLALVREERTKWLAGRLADVTAEDRQAIGAAIAALNRVSLGDR